MPSPLRQQSRTQLRNRHRGAVGVLIVIVVLTSFIYSFKRHTAYEPVVVALLAVVIAFS